MVTDVSVRSMSGALGESWMPNSWRSFKSLQQPQYPNEHILHEVEGSLSASLPLIFADEARTLLSEFAELESRKTFVFQSGDCAETFNALSANLVRDNVKLLLQSALIIMMESESSVVRIMRGAGQFAKPRSSEFEVVGSVSLPSYRGDLINSIEFDGSSRSHDPQRMLQGYYSSSATMNLIRAFSSGGLADLAKTRRWLLPHNHSSRHFIDFQNVIKKAEEIATNGHGHAAINKLFSDSRKTEIYSSHEALLLPYEEALTREDSFSGGHFLCSTHFPWLGERTRQLDGAHVEFLRGIENPIGVKLGPSATADDVGALAARLNPENVKGKLVLITRMGCDQIRQKLPQLLTFSKSEGLNFTWLSDPMHGNTVTAPTGLKTRNITAIIDELEGFFQCHEYAGTYAGGVHLEATSSMVTECVGGNVTQGELGDIYTTACDPRLNLDQVHELAFWIANRLRIYRKNGEACP